MACMSARSARRRACERYILHMGASSSALSRAPVQLQSETCFDLRALGHVEFDLFAAHYFEFDLRALGHSGFHQCR